MSISEERMELGIAALKSGDYAKGKAFLHYTEDGKHLHCCLGVFTLVAIANGLEVSREMVPATGSDPERETFGGKDDEELMCQEVMSWYGFTRMDPELITADGNYRIASLWNDNGPSPDNTDDPEEDFTAIAAGFRRTFLEGR